MKPEEKLFFYFMAAIAILTTISVMTDIAVNNLQADVDALSTQVQVLQTERVDMDALQAELEDIKSVQGYISWERDWRNQRVQP